MGSRDLVGNRVGVAWLLMIGLAACSLSAPVSTNPRKGVSQSPGIRTTPRPLVRLTGSVLVPASLVSDAGGSLVSNNAGGLVARGGGIVSDHAGSLISNNSGGLVSDAGGSLVTPGGRYRLKVLDELSLEGARIYLADARGVPFRGIPPVQSDATGGFAIPDVPRGLSYQIVATLPTAAGEIRLTSLSLPGRATPITIASTVVTQRLLKDTTSRALAELPSADLFEKLSAAVKQKLNPADGKLAFVKDQEKSAASIMTQVLETQPELTRVLTSLQQALQKVTADDEQFAAGLKEGPSPSPEPLPAPVSSPQASVSPSAEPVPTPTPTSTPTAIPSGLTGLVSSFWGIPPNQDGPGQAARFFSPSGIVSDATGNLYIADSANHRIRKLTPNGMVSTFAGSTAGDRDGLLMEAQFDSPTGIAIDRIGNLYVTDTESHRIRKITPAGQVTTLAGSTKGYQDLTGTNAQFDGPSGLAVDDGGNVFVADLGNHCIRKVTPAGQVTTLAGQPQIGSNDGTGPAARFHSPLDITIDQAGILYVVDDGNGSIRRVTPAGAVTTLLGDLNKPSGITIDANGVLYVTNTPNHVIKKIPPPYASATVLAGVPQGAFIDGFADGPANLARFNAPNRLTVDPLGNVYVTDINDHLVRRIAPDGTVTTPAGLIPQTGSPEQLRNPNGVAFDDAGNLYIADTDDHQVKKVSPTGQILWVAGATPGDADGTGASAAFQYPMGVACDRKGNTYVAEPVNHRIRKITPDGMVSTLAGSVMGSADGTGGNAQFSSPNGLVVSPGGDIYVADSGNHRIRKITPDGLVSTLAGSSQGDADGFGTAAKFNTPVGVALDLAGNLYVTDSINALIRKVTPDGAVSSLFDRQQPTLLNNIQGIVLDQSGNVYVSDIGVHQIFKVTPSGILTSLAGSQADYADGRGTSARFRSPNGLAMDRAGHLYVADAENNLIRKIQ